MHASFKWIFASLVLASPLATGCSEAVAEPRGATTAREELDDEAAADAAYSQGLDDVQASYAGCAATQGGAYDECPHTFGFSIPNPFDGISRKVCDVLKDFRNGIENAERAYYFEGASLTVADGLSETGGVDLVWDLYNQQAAAFTYGGPGIGTSAGVGVSAYAGYGFGKKDNVIDAWSGEFVTGSATVNLPAPFSKVAVGASGFVGLPDRVIKGGAISVSLGFGASALGIVSASVSDGNWTPFDPATEALAKTSGHARRIYTHEYVQFDGSKDLAVSILAWAPPQLAPMIAAQAVAIGAIKGKTGFLTAICR